MKKVLLAFDGTQFSEGAFQFARWLNRVQPILLTGVFIPQISYANLWSYSSAMAGAPFIPLLEKEDTDNVNQNIMRFERLCEEEHIRYTVHKDFYNFALPELKRETRFADLLVICSQSFYNNVVGEDASEYMKDALHASECPVVVVPENYVFPQKNIIAYDGSSSSVFAIKQFAYLLPELCKNETLLLYISNEDVAIPDKTIIEELVQQHFANISFQKIDMRPKDFLNSSLNEKKDTMLISGSFSRSIFSQILRKSFVAETIAEHTMPVFIAHK